MTPLERITTRINANGQFDVPGSPVPLVTLEEFFDGNTSDGSICCNLTPTPDLSEVYAVLKQIRSRGEVADVRVQITMFEDPDDWPFSDTVWVITTAAPETVRAWFPEAIAPDQCSAGWTEGERFEPVAVPQGYRPVSCWWD
jgi:hypothetical protein